MDIEDNDGLSESSAGSYEAREEWTEEEYRKLMMTSIEIRPNML